ncbi:MAG: cytochrome c3 family protein [Actinobacteria bacterium]|nr:cytochrome c3 family protein [Actinomycetota bacterium]
MKLPDFSDPIARTRFILYAGALVIVLLFIIATAVPVFSNPDFCGNTCHDGGPAQYEAWKRSSHSKITCYACHTETGLVNVLKEKAAGGIGGLIGITTGNYEKPVNAESHLGNEIMTVEPCERCHDIESRKWTFSRGLIMNHEAHIKAKLTCTKCHNRVAHLLMPKYEKGEEKEHKYKNFLSMTEGCMRCHSSSRIGGPYKAPNGKVAPTACSTCHNADAAMPAGHDATWRSVHGKIARQNMKYCMECHDKEARFNYDEKIYCIRCHDQQTIKTFGINE